MLLSEIHHLCTMAIYFSIAMKAAIEAKKTVANSLSRLILHCSEISIAQHVLCISFLLMSSL